jgi:hypothetical protein
VTANREIVVVANDIVPGMGLPVAAPGLRAWGIALGLRSQDHPVTLVVDDHVVGRAWTRGLPAPRPAGTLVLSGRQAGDLVRSRRPRAVILTNSNHFANLGDVGDVPLIYDFFAPKMLELAEQESDPASAALSALRKRKLAALATCRAVIINGEKKGPYVEAWLAQAGRSPGEVPTAQVPMPVPVTPRAQRDTGAPLHAIVSGYLQPWSRPGAWAKSVLPRLADGSLVLHLLLAKHWGGDRAEKYPESFTELTQAPGVVTHGLMEFGRFRETLSRCDLAIDVFERNPERELAMVTRTLVAVACGLPVIHVPFTESGLLVERYGAGWLVDGDDGEGVARAVDSAINEPRALALRRTGAAALGRKVLSPAVATEPLHRLIESQL